MCLVAVVALAGCASQPINIPKPITVKSADEAGTVLIAPTMVAPWDDIRASLAPAFTMTGQDALTSGILPDTEAASQSTLNATLVALGLGFPQSGVNNSSSQTQQTAKGSSTAADVTTTAGSSNNQTNNTQSNSTVSGTAPAVPVGTPTAASVPSAQLGSPSGTDPTLRWKAADYLHQSVQLLNEGIDYTVRHGCYIPYVVKLKLAFMPYVNPLAYSAHTQVSFLEGRDSRPHTYPYGTKNAAGLVNETVGCTQHNRVPIVVPFLVADDLQVALNSHSAETARQIALAASFMTHGVDGMASANNVFQALTAISNQELTSTLTVSRTVDNGLYILIQPNNQMTGAPTLVGQTYDVAVLLLIPKSYFTTESTTAASLAHPKPADISILSHTEFRDARTGAPLPGRSADSLGQSIEQLLDEYLTDAVAQKTLHHLSVSEKENLVGPLVSAVQSGDYSAFNLALGNPDCPIVRNARQNGIVDGGTVLCLDDNYGPALWAGITGLALDAPYKSADLEAPLPAQIEIPSQNVLISDDASGLVTATLSGVSGSSASSLSAVLDVPPRAGGAPTTPLRFAAQSLTLTPATHTLVLVFASPAKAGLAPAKKGADAAAGPVAATLTISQVPCDSEHLCPDLVFDPAPGGTTSSAVFAAEIDLKPKPKPFDFATGSTSIILSTDSTGTVSGTLLFNLNTLPTTGVTANAKIAGATVMSVTGPDGKPVTAGKTGFPLASTGLYQFALKNLRPGDIVTATVSGTATGAAVSPPDLLITYAVVAPQSTATSKGGS